MIPKSVRHVQLNGQVWSAAIDYRTNHIFLDVRDREKESIHIARLDLSTLDVELKTMKHSWWSQLFSAEGGVLYFTEYLDQSDPTQKKYFSIDWSTGVQSEVVETEIDYENVLHPIIYEHGSEHHKTVSDFLSLELPLSCEYLEWDDKIIISYYLRFGNGFERFLLLLKDGKKEWKIRQDDSMKGFSPGSFFVFMNQLIFIKDRNEVCVYTG